MRQMVLETLHRLLESNMGNRLTPELVTGVLTNLNHTLVQAESAPAVSLAPAGVQQPAPAG